VENEGLRIGISLAFDAYNHSDIGNLFLKPFSLHSRGMNMNKKEIEKIKIESYRQGYDDGYNDGETLGISKGTKLILKTILELINDD